MRVLGRSCAALLLIIAYICNEGKAYANTSLIEPPLATSETSWGSLLKEKLRLQNYSEFMTPALSGSSVPDPKGGSLVPTFVDGRVWVDYELTPKFRLLYWQRYFIFPFNDYSIYDPRIGIRWMQVFEVPGLNTTYDFYVLPGISNMAKEAHRTLEIGIRTNTAYSIPGSRWDLGFVSETNATFYNADIPAKSIWGVLAPWTSYKISSKFSTQHWFMFPVKYQQGNFAWDLTGMPFVQNGIGWSASESVWFGTFVNNYLFTAPTLENTWVSVWLNLSVI